MTHFPFLKEKCLHELRFKVVTIMFEFEEGSDNWTSPYGWIRNDPQGIAETIKSCRSICISESFFGDGFCIGWHPWFQHIHLVSEKPSFLCAPLDSQVFMCAVRWIPCIFCFHLNPIHSYCKSLFLSFSSWSFVALPLFDLDGSHCRPLGTWTNTLAFTLVIIMA